MHVHNVVFHPPLYAVQRTPHCATFVQLVTPVQMLPLPPLLAPLDLLQWLEARRVPPVPLGFNVHLMPHMFPFPALLGLLLMLRDK